MRVIFFLLLVLYVSNFLAQDTLSISSLSKQQFSQWKGIEDKWKTEKFQPFLKTERIKLTCAGCSSVYIRLVFKKSGQITTFIITKTKKCGEEFNAKQLKTIRKLLDEIKLPEEFNESIFKIQIGIGLSC